MPSEAFRLGRTRVFFRAGQISILQEILNDTSAARGPAILGRLQEALANRHTAKGAAEEAQVSRMMRAIRTIGAQYIALFLPYEANVSDRPGSFSQYRLRRNIKDSHYSGGGIVNTRN